jgi:hypothetical protein
MPRPMGPAMGLSVFEAASMALSLASAGVFLLVARAVRSRPVSQESQRARTAFVTWWAILAGVSVAGLVLALPGATTDLTLYLVLLVGLLGLLCVGLWGLLFYLLYLFTSRRDLAIPLALGYVLYFVFLAAVILNAHPTGFEQTETGKQLVYEHPIKESPLYWPVVLLLTGPPLAAAVGYLSLYWKVDQQVQKRRILMVSGSIIVWFGSSLVGTSLGVSEDPTWSLVSRTISLLAALTIYYAYRGLKPGEPQSDTPSAKPADEMPMYGAPPRKGASRIVHIGPVA